MKRLLGLLIPALAAFLVPNLSFAAGKKDMQAEIRKVAAQTLQQLYKVEPSAKGRIEKATGYAVFSNFGMKILFAGGGKGEGVAVNHRQGHQVLQGRRAQLR